MWLTLAAFCAWAKAGDPADRYIAHFQCSSGQFGLRLPSDARILFQLAPILRQATGKVEQEEGYSTIPTYLSYSGLELGFIALSNDPSRYMISYAEVISSD